MRKLLEVDYSNLLYRQTSVHRRLSHDDVFTGGLYGFLDGITAGIKKVGATDIVICKDVKPYRRQEAYPGYKAGRSEKADPELRELYLASLPFVDELIRLLQLPTLAIPGFEADDLIGAVLRSYSSRFDLIVAQSTDADLMTLLGHKNFRIMKAAKDPLVGLEELAGMMFGATPEEYHMALALSGTHNAVEGISGIGPVKAMAAVRDPVRLRQLKSDNPGVFERNMELIRLPHPELQGVRLPPRPGKFDLRGLYRFAARFDINIRPDMQAALEQVLT